MAGELFLKHDGAGGFTETEAVQIGGVGNADKVPSLNASGTLDPTMMPTGIGADTATLEASGAIAAGDFVNIFDDGGTAKMRKADASSPTTAAHGFVLAAVADAATGTVYFEGNNTGVTGQTAGVTYLSTTAGLATSTAPSGSGEIVQRLGVAVAATVLNFESTTPVTLA